jgi:hypothetical protein
VEAGKDTTIRDAKVGLTPELLAEICPVARSDRREHRGFFTEIISDHALKDDAAFYTALLERIRVDHAFLRRFGLRFLESRSPKDKKKSFGIRASFWLRRRIPNEIESGAFLDLPEEYFPHLSPERELLSLFKAFWKGEDGEVSTQNLSEKQNESDVVPMMPFLPDADWRAVRDRLRAKLEAFDSPDPVRADEIRTEAEILAAACAAADEAENEVRLVTLRRGLSDRLSALSDFEGASTLISEVGTAGVVALEILATRADELLAAYESLVGADHSFAEKRAEYLTAHTREEWSRISILTAELADLQEQRTQADRGLRDGLSKALVLMNESPPVDTKTVTTPETPPQGPVLAHAAVEAFDPEQAQRPAAEVEQRAEPTDEPDWLTAPASVANRRTRLAYGAGPPSRPAHSISCGGHGRRQRAQ